MNKSSEVEIKRIYEKSIRLLNDKQARLMGMRQVLKKAVIRLSLVARDDDERINEVLKDIKLSVGENIELDSLNQHLDDLFLMVNQSGSLDVNKIKDEVSNMREDGIQINHVLDEIINQLNLSHLTKENKSQLTVSLSKPIDRKNLKSISRNIILLINKCINSLEQEKIGLEEFITKVCSQLSDIQSYTHLLHYDVNEAKERSNNLVDTVESGVSEIESVVIESTKLNELKLNVTQNLKGIKKHVEDFKVIGKEKEEKLSERYVQIIEELSRAQEESLALKEELHENRILLLRDPLTGIANRLAYEERITVEYNRWQRNGSPLCLAIWDIDHFKSVNDTYGHATGDKVLKLFSDILNKRIRKVDLFARVGGEEFVLLMPDTPLDAALTLNNKLRVTLEQCNFHYEGNDLHVTSSVGIAEFLTGEDPELVMGKADNALYQSKNDGRNRCTVFGDKI